MGGDKTNKLKIIYMKKAILTLSLIGAMIHANAQAKKPILNQQEASQVINSLQSGLKIIHSNKVSGEISALTRDSLDMYIGGVYQFLDQRNKEAIKADTAKSKIGNK